MWEFCDCLAEFAECFLSFENVEWMSEKEKIMIKKNIKIAEYDLDEEANGFNLIQDEG